MGFNWAAGRGVTKPNQATPNTTHNTTHTPRQHGRQQAGGGVVGVRPAPKVGPTKKMAQKVAPAKLKTMGEKLL